MKNKPNLIGISGHKQSGKSLIAEIIRYLLAINSHSLRHTEPFDSTVKYTESNWEQKAFAGKVKEILCLLTGCTMKDLANEEFKSSYMPEEWDNKIDLKGNTYGRITYRQSLQLIGTDLFRDKFHSQSWINALFADYKNPTTIQEMVDLNCFTKEDESNWIITDCRFLNEVETIKARGGVIIRTN